MPHPSPPAAIPAASKPDNAESQQVLTIREVRARNGRLKQRLLQLKLGNVVDPQPTDVTRGRVNATTE